MYYKLLDSKTIELGARDSEDFDAGDKEVILIPQDDTRVFVHWLNEEKVLATYTMISPVRSNGKIRLTNGTNLPVTVKIVKL